MSHDSKSNTERLMAYQLRHSTPDPIEVANLRGYAAHLWARYPHMLESAVKLAMSEHSSRIGATDAELAAAVVNIVAVRDDEPAPITRRTGWVEPPDCAGSSCKLYGSCDHPAGANCFEPRGAAHSKVEPPVKPDFELNAWLTIEMLRTLSMVRAEA
jgi:hypothetical protein